MNTITAVHIHSESKLRLTLAKVRPAINLSDQLWISSSSREVLESVKYLPLQHLSNIEFFFVENEWHDWSGYLSFLKNVGDNTKIIIANDSIVTRRYLSSASVKSILKSSNHKLNFLAGDLDTASTSVLINGQSSACWISTYLFALHGIKFDWSTLESVIRDEVERIIKSKDHAFIHYLSARRRGYIENSKLLSAKIGAMCFERHLTRIAMNQGLDIVNTFAGNKVRKIEKFLERIINK